MKSNSNKTYINFRNNSMLNNNLMLNYLKNNKINNNLNNINKSNNNSIKNDTNYFHFKNEYSKDFINRRNRVNIFEENSKLIKTRKILNLKNSKEESSKPFIFYKDKKMEKAMSFNYNYISEVNDINIKNSRSHNKKKDILNKIRIYSLNDNMKTITYGNIFKKKEEKNKTLINFKIRSKDTKYLAYKKEIFEKVSKNLDVDGRGKKNESIIEFKNIKKGENKNYNIRINKKSKSQLETENNNEKMEEKEKNQTEIFKSDDKNIFNKNEKKIENNKIIKLENKNKKEMKDNQIKEKIKINESKDITNEKDENKEKNIKNNENKINEKENIINKEENIINKEEKNNKKEELLNTAKENKKDKGKKEDKENNCNNNYIDTEQEFNLSYFDITKIKEDSQIPKEYLNNIYHNLLTEEEKGITPKPIYEKIKNQKEINEQMRSILVDWIIDVHYKFGFMDETLFMTILIIDRYISIKHISKIRFQLLGITAMLIACKHEEINLPKIDDFIYITDNAYTKDEVFIMENDILHIFNFELLYPSPIKFYEFLSLKFNFDKKQYLMGKYLMETFLIDLKWINYRPSVISCACAYIVMKFYKIENYQETYNKKYYNLNENDCNNPKYSNEYDIKECAKDICYFVDNINKTNYLSCKKKYANEDNEKISLVVEGQNP